MFKGRDLDALGLSSDEWTAIELSLRVSIVAMLVSLPFGIGAALLLARGRFWGKSILNGLIHLPLILPPVVTGFILLILFGRKGPIGSLLEQYLGLVFSYRWTGAALACGVMGFPLMVRSIRLSVEAVDRKLEEAAGTLGASPIWTFVTVTLPLSMPGILASSTTAFAWTFSAFATPQMIGGGRVPTLSTLVYQLGLSSLNFPLAASLSVIGLALTAVSLLVFGKLTVRLKRIGGH